LGRVPRLVAADAAFYSACNEAAAKAKDGWRAALMAVYLSGVSLRPPWTRNRSALGRPFDLADPHHRLPQAPEVKAERSAAHKRWRERVRTRKAAQLAAQRGNTAGTDVAA
jgi:hypothetical protein